MTVEISSQIQINASPDAVFKFLQHLKYHYLWNPHLREIEPIKPLAKGVTYNTKSSLFGIDVSGHNTVTKYTPNKEIQIENNAGTIKYSVNYSIKPINSARVTVICTTGFTTSGYALKFTGKALKAIAHRELQSDLQALKLAVEHDLA